VTHLDLTERILRLRSVPVFRTVPASTLAALASSIRARGFDKGEALQREDGPPRSIFLINSGTVGMERRGRRIGTVRAPGGVGFLPFLAREQGATSSIAQSFVEAYEVPGEALDEILDDDFSVLLETMRWVAERMVSEMRNAEPPPYTPPETPHDDIALDRELGIVDRIFLLRRTRAFGRANVNSLARVARRMVEQRPPPGATIWSPGAPADASLFVVKGMGRLVWNGGASVQSVGPGYVVGGMESLLGGSRWNTFVADEPMLLLRGREETLLDMFEDDREVGMIFLSMIASFLIGVWDRKAEQGLTSVGSPVSAEVEGPRPSVR
jgi:CRP-like cAMP-binding protein